VTSGRGEGFTLVELVIVVFIVALLLSIGLPAYQKQLMTMRRSVAGAELREVRIRQEQYFLDYKNYPESLTELGYPASPYAIDSEGDAVAPMDGNRIYVINLTTHRLAYTLLAVPQFGQIDDKMCGTLSLKSSGIKLQTGTGTTEDCW
jgi:type IV pilus assembly protein PilE